MERQKDVYPYNGKLFHHENEWSPDSRDNVDGTWKHYAKSKKPGTKNRALWFHFYERSRRGKSREKAGEGKVSRLVAVLTGGSQLKNMTFLCGVMCFQVDCSEPTLSFLLNYSISQTTVTLIAFNLWGFSLLFKGIQHDTLIFVYTAKRPQEVQLNHHNIQSQKVFFPLW